MCTKCWQAEEKVTMYFGIIYKRMNPSHKEQPVIGILFPYITGNGILLPKLFWPTVRENCSSDREKLQNWNSRLKAENLQNFWDH